MAAGEINKKWWRDIQEKIASETGYNVKVGFSNLAKPFNQLNLNMLIYV